VVCGTLGLQTAGESAKAGRRWDWRLLITLVPYYSHIRCQRYCDWGFEATEDQSLYVVSATSNGKGEPARSRDHVDFLDLSGLVRIGFRRHSVGIQTWCHDQRGTFVKCDTNIDTYRSAALALPLPEAFRRSSSKL
jgi:hypothetical protein